MRDAGCFAADRGADRRGQQARAGAARTAPASAAPIARDIGGAIPGGEPLLPGVDYSKLSPLQQITLGLRDAKPVGPARTAVVYERGTDAMTRRTRAATD